MPQTVEIQAYTFQELTEKAKQEVITRLAPDHEWWDYIYEQAKEEGKALGFEIDRINFSDFYSQGDGACWVGIVRLKQWLELNKPHDPHSHIALALIEDGWASDVVHIATHHSRYSHSNTMNHEGFNIVEPVGDMTIEVGDMFVGANVKQLFDSIGAGYFDSLLVDVLQSARDYADKIYVHLRDEYEWLCSEEYITELCDANEYLFDASGRFI
jgi:hypothetical protein